MHVYMHICIHVLNRYIYIHVSYQQRIAARKFNHASNAAHVLNCLVKHHQILRAKKCWGQFLQFYFIFA